MPLNTRTRSAYQTCCLTALAFLLAATPAGAGDVAERDILGFDDDARHFAFEVFGRQDGSGFPYAEITIIDLLNDTWVGGSPFRVRIEDETMSVTTARDQVRSDAEASLTSLGIVAPYALLASNPPTELDADQTRVTFRPRAVLADIEPSRTVTLETFTLPAAEICEAFGDMKGLALTIETDGEATEIYRDDNIPESRGCPLDYGISDIIVPFEGDSWRAVALISVFQVGFEGPDRRFIAVPVPLEAK
ncbi:MAG: DUF2259 domain-containing protein [Pseudomonadota bacterium]